MNSFYIHIVFFFFGLIVFVGHVMEKLRLGWDPVWDKVNKMSLEENGTMCFDENVQRPMVEHSTSSFRWFVVWKEAEGDTHW